MESFISKNRLVLRIIAGVLLGGAVGSFFPEFGAGTQIIGELFLNALKMVVLPLIIVSITLSIMKVGNLGSLGLKTIAYYAVTMVLVLQAVGLPIEGIGIILAIDWFLDRFRTTINVWGDSIGAAVIEKLEPDENTG